MFVEHQKPNILCKSTENQTCPLSWFLTPVKSDQSHRESSSSCLSRLFMNQKLTLSCLVASGGGNVKGVWIWLLWANAPPLLYTGFLGARSRRGHCMKPQV